VPKKIERIEDLQFDLRNANLGTERGQYMVEHSLSQYGAGRSIVADAEGRIIAGNKTLQAAADLGIPVRVVETDGNELVVVQRTDLDLLSEDKRARLLAYADNRSSEIDLEWNAEEIAIDLAEGVDLLLLFREDELDEIEELARISAALDSSLDAEYSQESQESRDINPLGRMIKVAINLPEIGKFEEAMTLTGETNRGLAMMAIIDYFLNGDNAAA